MIFQKHIPLKKVKKLSTWRRVAMSSWKRSRDPQTYGILKFNATPMLSFIDKYRGETGRKLTTTHLVCKALAKAIDENPEINCVIRGSHLYQRESVDIFMQVSLDDQGKDLSGLVVKDAPQKSLDEIIDQVQTESKSLREGKDKTFKKVKKSIKLTPLFAMRSILSLLDFILYRLNIWSPILGVQKDPFASAMISNVSQFGIEHGFVPIPAISHVPLIFALFAIKDEPIVNDGELAIQKTLTIGVTLDHRVIDGVYAGKITRALKNYIESPEQLL
jgi:pyruvate dehydrogenase E2 component (dihydrolipoamide acetyltransferase)